MVLQEGRLQEEVALRQDLIALARLHCQFDDGAVDATALARAHINLGGAYASIDFWKQAAIHGKRGLQQLEKVRSRFSLSVILLVCDTSHGCHARTVTAHELQFLSLQLPLNTPGYIPIERGGHALLGEALMNTQPPKPELAMEHLSRVNGILAIAVFPVIEG